MFQQLLSLEALTSQNGETHLNSSSAKVEKLFQFVRPFCEVERLNSSRAASQSFLIFLVCTFELLFKVHLLDVVNVMAFVEQANLWQTNYNPRSHVTPNSIISPTRWKVLGSFSFTLFGSIDRRQILFDYKLLSKLCAFLDIIFLR